MFCIKCGANNPNEAAFCSKCGNRLENIEKKEEYTAEQETITFIPPPPPKPVQVSTSYANIKSSEPLPKPDTDFCYAGFLRRLIAFLLDVIILALIFRTGLRAGNGLVGYITIYIIYWLYFAIFESTLKATPGKLVLGLMVTDLNGQKIKFARASGRFFAKVISVLILFIGYLMVLFTDKKQGLHDKMSGCIVIRKNIPKVVL